jgi:hypothetical protein
MPNSQLHKQVEHEEQEVSDNQTAEATNFRIHKKLRQSQQLQNQIL